MIVLLDMIQEFYCTRTRDYTNIPSCSGKLVFDSSRLQEGIFVYTLVKLYNKANILLVFFIFIKSLIEQPVRNVGYTIQTLHSNNTTCMHLVYSV